MRTITATEFRAKCLNILDNVPAEGIIVTKHGKEVARVMPASRDVSDLFGTIPDLIVGDADVFSTGIIWNAERGILLEDE